MYKVMSVLQRLLHGPRGHPVHPPLADAAIGMLVLAGGLGVVVLHGLPATTTTLVLVLLAAAGVG